MSFFRRFFAPRRAPTRAETGQAGEAWAARWLTRHRGFRVLARNWRNPSNEREELDLVAQDGEVLVFVEVKTRAMGASVTGYYSVDRRKKRALLAARRSYLRLLRRSDRPNTIRLDVVEVHWPSPAERAAGIEPEVRHFENVKLWK